MTPVSLPRGAGKLGCGSVDTDGSAQGMTGGRGPGTTGTSTRPGRKQSLGPAQPGRPGEQERAGTRGSQAATSFSVLVILLLLKLGHQAEFTAAAALGKIQHHVLWGKRETVRVRPRFTKTSATPRPHRHGARKTRRS